MAYRKLPVPPHYRPESMTDLYRINLNGTPQGGFQDGLATQAHRWAQQHNLTHVATDPFKIAMLLIDVQDDFCNPAGNLFVGGAVEDNQRLARFIYENLGHLTHLAPTLDTHTMMQIFHSIYLVDRQGNHPAPYTMIDPDAVAAGDWVVNPEVAHSVGGNAGTYMQLNAQFRDYVKRLHEGTGDPSRTGAQAAKYLLTIWPYHTLLGTVGHTLVGGIMEACLFHTVARRAQTDFQIKGGKPTTENYSIFKPEVLVWPDGRPMAQKNTHLLQTLLRHDAVIIAGQAGSHCVAWTIDDLLQDILALDPKLAQKVHILRDCTSPVIVPGVVDWTDEMNRAFDRFQNAGMHLVSTTQELASWPGIRL
jgi:nicotinamidase-related amidase